MPKIIDNDINYLNKLQDYYGHHRSFPAYARLCDVLGLAAKSAVKKVLERLEAQGYLRRTADGVWIPAPRFFARTKIDFRIPAGSPVSTSEGEANPFGIDEYLIKNPSRTLCLPVQGDSMVDAGIHDGDLVVVERRTQADSGVIVVAIVDGEFTIKTLDVEEGEFVLRPANPAYSTIRPRSTLEIFGVVVGLIRKYRS